MPVGSVEPIEKQSISTLIFTIIVSLPLGTLGVLLAILLGVELWIPTNPGASFAYLLIVESFMGLWAFVVLGVGVRAVLELRRRLKKNGQNRDPGWNEAMTPSRTIRWLFIGSMLVSMVVVIGWAGVVGWRMWPEWRAVREMRRAVEENEPGRFLEAVEAVDQLGVAEAAADEIAPLCHHADPRVRMYAVMARTLLGPRGPSEARELIALLETLTRCSMWLRPGLIE